MTANSAFILKKKNCLKGLYDGVFSEIIFNVHFARKLVSPGVSIFLFLALWIETHFAVENPIGISNF